MQVRIRSDYNVSVSRQLCVLQQLEVTLDHVVSFNEPSPNVSVPTPLSTMRTITAAFGKFAQPFLICCSNVSLVHEQSSFHSGRGSADWLLCCCCSIWCSCYTHSGVSWSIDRLYHCLADICYLLNWMTP